LAGGDGLVGPDRSPNAASPGNAYSEIAYYKLDDVRNSKAFLTGADDLLIKIVKISNPSKISFLFI
jgi:hypothetical protein